MLLILNLLNILISIRIKKQIEYVVLQEKLRAIGASKTIQKIRAALDYRLAVLKALWCVSPVKE